MYRDSDALSKTVIISLLDRDKYKKDDINEIFGCSKYQVDVAQKLKSGNAGLAIPHQEEFKRSGLLQDVAYGVTKVNFDSGEEQKVAHAVLTAKVSHTIVFYQESC